MSINESDELKVLDMAEGDLDQIAGKVLGKNVNLARAVTMKPIGRSFGADTLGIYHVAGSAQSSEGEEPWSAVVKVLGQPDSLYADVTVQPQKELEVYRSGVFAELCGGIRSAQCYSIQERNGSKRLWLEDLTGAPQTPWQSDYYIQCARHIGQFNAHWPLHALPQWGWLSQGGFEQFKGARMAKIIAQLPTRQYEPFICRVTSPDSTRRLLNLWERSDALFAQAALTSSGVCHLDCHPKNLFPMLASSADLNRVTQSHTVGIDWMKVGIGYLGMDVGLMLISPIKWMELSPGAAKPLIEPVFHAYVDGLKESGWKGSEEQVQLTFVTILGCEAFRTISATVGIVDEPDLRKRVEKNFGPLTEEFYDNWAEPLIFLLDCADEALALARRLAS